MPFGGSPGLRTVSAAELAAHRTPRSLWAVFRGRVFDLTAFLADHPGGPDFIVDAVRECGGDVGPRMLDPLLHAHSDSAFEMLEGMCIGVLEGADGAKGAPPAKVPAPNADFDAPEVALRETAPQLGVASAKFVDPAKPMLAQVFFGNYSKRFYLEQVHIPRHVKGSAPIFGNFLEALTKTPWWIVPLVWLPFGQAHTAYAAWRGLSLAELVVSWCLGLVVWTVIEYSLHRWLFHIDRFLPDNRYFLTLHFLMHGIHHFLPMDKWRLVMPPALFTILMIPIYKLFLLVFLETPLEAHGYAVGGGTLFGYVLYDCMHYYLHHGRVWGAYAREMKGYHLDHHYKQAERGFGITSKVWDWVWGTGFTI
ncbi:hypothetical protein DFJ74DRAFT_608960 [Hyaloraphidium curvatum]|nr:hypothetical protein DFJ74DRAFT_608960 [Hyaloraphidium curvatum]